jgi:hypothetical protein
VEVCAILDGHARACLAMCTASICSSHLATVSINMLLQQATLLEKPTDVNAFARKELLHKARAQASPHRERQVHMLIHVVLIVLPAFSGPSGQGCRLPRQASGHVLWGKRPDLHGARNQPVRWCHTRSAAIVQEAPLKIYARGVASYFYFSHAPPTRALKIRQINSAILKVPDGAWNN